jgi:hypothetical protein
MTRASITLHKTLSKKMDCRVKPGNDECSCAMQHEGGLRSTSGSTIKRGVPRMLRSTPLFAACCAAKPGPLWNAALVTVPALRCTVKRRCTASGTRRHREELHAFVILRSALSCARLEGSAAPVAHPSRLAKWLAPQDDAWLCRRLL